MTIDVTIGHAVNLAYSDLHPDRMDNYSEFKSQAWDSFYNLSPLETTFFIVSALRKLLTVRPVKSAAAVDALIEPADKDIPS